MPIYEYVCEKCGSVSEVIQKHGDDPPECCERPMKIQIGKTSFVLKGSGWYETEYGKKSKGC